VIVRRDGQRIRLITDALGSVRAAVDIDTGAVLQRLSYDAYGRTTQDTNPGLQPYGYKGAFTDPVAEGAGLVWMGVRAYQPALARFTTPDPQGLAAVWNDADALAGDPVNLTDGDGLFPSRNEIADDKILNGFCLTLCTPDQPFETGVAAATRSTCAPTPTATANTPAKHSPWPSPAPAKSAGQAKPSTPSKTPDAAGAARRVRRGQASHRRTPNRPAH
jgi:RHS repeat-associated protein